MAHKIWKRRWNGELPKPATQDPDLGSIPLIIQNFLIARGYKDPAQWRELFLPKTELASPSSLKGMEPAIERLVEAFRKQEKICLYADFDLDGTSGLALGLDGFKQLGFQNIVPYQPLRLKDGYGFHDFAVRDLHERGVSLIVTIDVGITAVKACRQAKELGVDVIITDHHQAGSEFPEALSVINPNQYGCESQLGYLCGAGVLFYVLRALSRELVDLGLVDEKKLSLRSLLDLLTIAAVTDMVPLRGDNRWLVKQGLKVLSTTQRPGLRSLMHALKMNSDSMTTADVGIRLAPKLNALSRLETGLRPLDIYLAPSLDQADELVAEVLEKNADRLDLQTSGENIATDLLKDWNRRGFVMVISPEFHRGVVGLIATKLAGQFNAPAYVGALGDDGMVVGSARSPSGSAISVLKGLESVAPLMNRFGGHNPAAGFEFAIIKKEEILDGLEKHFASQSEEAPIEIEYDLDLRPQDISSGLVRWIESLEPFGVGFSAPTFRIEDMRVESCYRIKGVHWKLTLNGIEAIYFSPPENLQIRKGQKVSLIGELQHNTFRGLKSLQIVVKDLIVSSEKGLLHGSEISPPA